MGRPAPEFSGCRKKLYLYSEHSLRQYEGTNREIHNLGDIPSSYNAISVILV